MLRRAQAGYVTGGRLFGYPDYVRNLPRTIPEDVPAVRPAFAAFLRPEGFLDTDTYGRASPRSSAPFTAPGRFVLRAP